MASVTTLVTAIAGGFVIIKVCIIGHWFISLSNIVTVYDPGARLFLWIPAVGLSFQTTEMGATPPVKFKSILPSFSLLQEIGLTMGAIKNIGWSIVMVTFASHWFSSTIVII